MVTFNEFKLLISDALGIEISLLNKHVSLRDDIGVDSLSVLNFIIQLEKQFNIKVEPDPVWRMKDLGQMYDLFISTLNAK